MEQTPKEQLDEKFLKAASAGNIEKAVECLTNGANLNAKTFKGNNAIYLAATRNRKDFFDWIINVTQKENSIDLNNINSVGDPLLFDLVREKVDVYYVDKLLATKKVDVDAPSRTGGTALLQACANIDLETAECLVKYNASPNAAVKENKTTPMLMASAEGNFDILKLLIENNGNINELDKTGKNILLNALFRPMTYMKEAQKKEHKEMLLFLVDTEIDLDYVAPSGVSAIWICAYSGHHEVLQKMLDKNVNVDRWHELTPSEGKISLTHVLCRQDKPEILKQVLLMGGKLSVADEAGNMPESYGFQNPKFRQLLLDNNADVNAVLYVSENDLNLPKKPMPIFPNIVAEGDSGFAMVDEMVKRGVKTNYKKEWDKFDPIMSAIVSSAPLITDLLLKQPSTDINKLLSLNSDPENQESYSYLSIACSNLSSSKLAGAMSQKKHFESLLNAQKENEKNGVQSEVINKEGFEAIQKGYDALKKVEEKILEDKKLIFNSLIKAGCDLDLPNEKNRTPLFYCQDAEYASWLQEAGANIFHKDNSGNTPFTHAIINGNTAMVDFYKNQYTATQNLDNMYYRMAFEDINTFSQQQGLEKGILHFAGGQDVHDKIYPKNKEDFQRQSINNINYQDNEGNTALLVACARDMPFLASLYYKLGADVNTPNNLGETSIMHAIATKNAQLVEFLVENGADTNAHTNAGKSVMDFAVETGKSPIIKALSKTRDNDVITPKKLKP